ncbi:MAG TPA: NAD(P)H-dependent oxidoreductase subunit E [Candidatus Limnocylindrales bacterium]
MSFIPGLGIAKGMALTLRRFFGPRATIQYPEVPADVAVRFRGRLQLLHDEWGGLKCETCFQCAQACPIECIDMGGVDTKGRFHVHWGPPETYGERREESALRRSGRTVPDQAYTHLEPIDLGPIDRILAEHDHDPKRMLAILEAVQATYGHIPVAALKQISFATGAWYAFLYGTASYYRHLRFDRPARAVQVCRCTSCLLAGSGRIADGLAEGLATRLGEAAPDGIRLEALPSHLPDAPSPLVALDGEPLTEVTEANAATWARALAGRTAA